jgi:enoyl-CoA hydratase/carnithine racemase
MMAMEEILTELTGNVLRVQLNRPAKKNAMTLAMYAALAELDRADKSDDIRVVLVHGAGDSFTAGNDIADFVSHPPGPGDSPQARFLDALIRFAELNPSEVICEIANDDGTMARLPDLVRFCSEHDLTMVSVADLVRYRIMEND